MNVLVVGYGSIGARHARLLSARGCCTAVVSSRAVEFPLVYTSLEVALAEHRPEYVVIASATDRHHEDFTKLVAAGYSGSLLIEKPVFFERHVSTPRRERTFVAYNLRFHPVIRRLRESLQGESILSVCAYVGQYLPDWRPTFDYRTSYSAGAARGGGALRDLSHELDYLGWILGGWTRLAAVGGHASSLEIDSDDVFALLMSTPRCPTVTLQVNYLDRAGRRFVIVNTDRRTFEADLVRGAFTVDRATETFVVDRDATYDAMHGAVLEGRSAELCSFAEALDTVALIDAAERAARSREWVVK